MDSVILAYFHVFTALNATPVTSLAICCNQFHTVFTESRFVTS